MIDLPPKGKILKIEREDGIPLDIAAREARRHAIIMHLIPLGMAVWALVCVLIALMAGRR